MVSLKFAGLFSLVLCCSLAGIWQGSQGVALGKFLSAGDRGPAGGWIVYDKGSYSDGWRYIEAAPDVFVAGAWGEARSFGMGNDSMATGRGRANSLLIVNNSALPWCAARVAMMYRGGGMADWFLPSADELKIVYGMLIGKGIMENKRLYWSSSEYSETQVWMVMGFDGGAVFPENKIPANANAQPAFVWPVRYF